ncbi:MAG: tetratricopeptide repeat protein [Candidatus Limnocylindrales bacterium]
MSDSVSVRYKDALQRGHVAVVKGMPREAIGHYEQAAALVPDRPLPFIRIGRIYLRMEQPRQALQAFEAALERSPGDADALEGKAAALAASGRSEEAGLARTHAAQLAARDETGRSRRRPIDPRLLELERHVANGVAARMAGDTGVAAAAYLTAANGYVALNDFDAAIDACLRGLEARPGNLDIHFVMTMLYLRRGWIELGVQRAVLIEHRLDIDDDPLRRNALTALARDYRTRAAELERIATRSV